MSHLVTETMEIHDLDALAEAAEACGMELVRDQQTFKWYGRSVGDYPLPAGFTADDLGKCSHAVRVKGVGSQTYEIGVVERRDAAGNRLPGYSLLYDFWRGGFGLLAAAGKECSYLKQQYTLAGIKKTLGNRWRVAGVQTLENGSMKVVLS